jgi:hypothetical protein
MADLSRKFSERLFPVSLREYGLPQCDQIIEDSFRSVEKKTTILGHEFSEIIPYINSRRSSSPKGLIIFGDDKDIHSSCLNFANVKLGMADCKYIMVNGGIGKLMSPLSMKFASDLMNQVDKLLSDGSINRVVCIVRREDIDIPIVRALTHVPDGKDFVTYALARGKAMASNRLGINVEFYLMEPASEGYVFFKLD